MKISRTAFSKAIASNLSQGNRINSGKVIKALQKVGIDPRFKGEVKEHQLRSAFDKLKEEGLLKDKAQSAGLYSFKESVKKEANKEAHPELSAEKKLAFAKQHLRERLDEEAAKKQRITEAISGAKPEQKNGTSSAKTSSASHGVQQVQRASTSFGSIPRKETGARPFSAAELIERAERPSSSADHETSSDEKKDVSPLPKIEPPDMFGSSDE